MSDEFEDREEEKEEKDEWEEEGDEETVEEWLELEEEISELMEGESQEELIGPEISVEEGEEEVEGEITEFDLELMFKRKRKRRRIKLMDIVKITVFVWLIVSGSITLVMLQKETGIEENTKVGFSKLSGGLNYLSNLNYNNAIEMFEQANHQFALVLSELKSYNDLAKFNLFYLIVWTVDSRAKSLSVSWPDLIEIGLILSQVGINTSISLLKLKSSIIIFGNNEDPILDIDAALSNSKLALIKLYEAQNITGRIQPTSKAVVNTLSIISNILSNMTYLVWEVNFLEKALKVIYESVSSLKQQFSNIEQGSSVDYNELNNRLNELNKLNQTIIENSYRFLVPHFLILLAAICYLTLTIQEIRTYLETNNTSNLSRAHEYLNTAIQEISMLKEGL